MKEDVMLQLLKSNVNIMHDKQDDFLKARLSAAQKDISDTGIKLKDNTSDMLLVVDYAAWLFRKRDADTGFPRNLTYRLNSRLAAEKMGSEENDP